MNGRHKIVFTTSMAGFMAVMLLAGSMQVKAEEGMWIPMLLEKYQIGKMKEAGLRISAEEIYSINNDCLMDAVVIFGGGCTGELISSQGLLLTNHHCGEDEIQYHSSVEHNYLADGFWAMSRDEELPNPGLTVSFLRYMRDVTEEMNLGLKQGMDPQERERTLAKNERRIIRGATDSTHYDAKVSSFYYANAYYLFVYEKFRDVRLVGTPPVSIGNFGGDQDNWVWPRHTGDFSLFRVYADAEGNPAGYDPLNIPYRPRRHLEINTGGISEGDFTMVLGMPGTTRQYIHSGAVRHRVEKEYPLRIELRTMKLEIMDRYMKTSDRIWIQYAHKFRRVSNAWKMWQGVIQGLNRNNVVEMKLEEEEEFARWVNADDERRMHYDHLLDGFEALYGEYGEYDLAYKLMYEAVYTEYAVELFTQAMKMEAMMVQGIPADGLEAQLEDFYKDFHMPVDRDLFAALMDAYRKEMPSRLHPPFFEKVSRKHKGEFSAFADRVYGKTVLADREGAMKLLDLYRKDPGKAIKKLKSDPMSILYDQINRIYLVSVLPEYKRLQDEEAALYKSYMAALLEMHSDSVLYPDANGTWRVTYGKVKGYSPGDGVTYHHATTLDGVMEKGREEHDDYRVPDKLAELHRNRDYGPYGENGTMPVCFVASNHTSGGNSGSPVLDADGRLIGLNFDREWEGVMSDIYFDPYLSRNISVDIRYVLFIIDKFAGAGYLLEEMDIVR